MNTWMIVADASGARVFNVEGEKMILVRDEPNPKGRSRAQELTTDRPGRVLKGRGRNVMSSMQPRTAPHEAEEEHFAQKIGQLLEDAFDRQAFRWLVLVAPPHFLGLLRGTLTHRVFQTVVAAIDKDFAKLNKRDLQAALTDALSGLSSLRRLQEMGE